MGKQKYQEKIIELFEKSPVVSFSSIDRIIKNKEKSNQYAKQLLRNLILKNKIKKLAKGSYTLHNDPSIAVFSFNPSYLGLQDSLSKHDVWEQETIPVILTSKKVRQGIREINSSNVLIRRIDKKYIFGIEYLKEGEVYLPYSDIEKTFIDMIYFNENLSPEIIKSIKARINTEKLKSYLNHYSDKIKNKVNSFIS